MTKLTQRRLGADVLAGLLFLAIGLAVTIVASGYRIGTAGSMGPGYFPLALGILMTVFGLIIAGKGLASGGEMAPQFAFGTAAIVVLAMVAFGLLVERLGLVVAIPAVVLLSRLAGGDRRWIEIVALGVALTLFCLAVFVWALRAPLPVWPL